MPAPHNWNDALDNQLRQLRQAHASWDEISLIINRPVSTCMDRCRAIGAKFPKTSVPISNAEDISDWRQPLPPGHPVTWGLLTRGTVLENCPYS